MSDECPSHTTTINIYLTCIGIHAGIRRYGEYQINFK